MAPVRYRRPGRPRQLKPHEVAQLVQLYTETNVDTKELAKMFNVSVRTLYLYMQRARKGEYQSFIPVSRGRQL